MLHHGQGLGESHDHGNHMTSTWLPRDLRQELGLVREDLVRFDNYFGKLHCGLIEQLSQLQEMSCRSQITNYETWPCNHLVDIPS